jgi:UDP-N-acetylmuramoylalanine--D-glutamate ligase
MRVAILGYGEQGKSAAHYWSQQPDSQITICDVEGSLEQSPDYSWRLGPNYLDNLNEFDVIVRSPSIHPKDIVKHNDPEILTKVTSNTNEFMRICPSKHIIGITGTKGKGTTSTLISQMLNKAGERVHFGGNIGTPPLDLLASSIQPDDWIVLELANFQLIDLKRSPHIGICLMVVPEHLNWHTSFEEYIASKSQLFASQSPDDIAIYFADNETSQTIAHHGNGQKLPFYAPPGAYVLDDKIIINNQTVCTTGELALLGKHNWQNVCAAITAVWQVCQDVSIIHEVITNFTGLPHRLELVRELRGVRYYDDSFGTTPETAIVAIESFEGPKVIILGGSDKGADYTALAKVIGTHNVRAAITIGQTGPAITAALMGAEFMYCVDGGKTMSEIVIAAQAASQPGDIVLLSTGCASFGMFANYKDRGEQFTKAVQALV